MAKQDYKSLKVGPTVKRIIMFKRGESPLDGTYVKVPWSQRSDFARKMVKYLRKAGVEVGIYSFSEDAPTYGLIQTDKLHRSKSGEEIYEVIVQSDEAVQKVIEYLRNHHNVKKMMLS